MLEEAEAKLIHYRMLQAIAEFKKGKVEYRADKTELFTYLLGMLIFLKKIYL